MSKNFNQHTIKLEKKYFDDFLYVLYIDIIEEKDRVNNVY